jgi:taurine dioxygenase
MVSVERAGRALGARVTGVDLGAALDGEAFAAVRSALNQHSVLVFPCQQVEPPAHIEFSGRFGELKRHVLKENLLPGLPEIYVLTNMTSQNQVKPRPYAGAYWHTDLSYEEQPAFGSVMFAVEVPEVGGDTMFCSMAAAYDALSERMKTLLEGLTATHSFEHAYETFVKKLPGTAPISRAIFDDRPPVVHPVVHTHPESGRKCLYVNPGFTMFINELPPPESDAILQFLYSHCTDERFIYRHQWTQHDVVMWDNRATMHKAIPDYTADDDRYMRRTTIAGIAPRI